MGTVGYLLDTHALLWAVQDNRRLSTIAKTVIEDINFPLFVSAVSAYEIAYKHHIGKLQGFDHVVNNYFDVVRIFKADELAINARHAHFAGQLDWAHRDPFDRLLAAQAAVDDLILLTNDPVFGQLPWARTLW